MPGVRRPLDATSQVTSPQRRERIPPPATIPFSARTLPRAAAGARLSADAGAAQFESGRKTLLLLRHGATAPNSERRFIGSTDHPLSSFGRRQLTTAASSLRAYNPERCFCSPMRRCLETARAVLAGSPLQPEILPELREIDFGDWEGKTFEETQTSNQACIQHWAKFDPAFCFPGGERLADFISRVKRAAKQISSSPHSSVVVVTHGGVIRLLICHFLGLRMRKYVLFEPAPGSLTVMNLFDSGKGTLAALLPGGRPQDG